MYKTWVKRTAVLFVVAALLSGCGKKDPGYVKVGSNYGDLENVSIFSVDEDESGTAQKNEGKKKNESRDAITEGGSTKGRPSATPTPTPGGKRGNTGSSQASGSIGGGGQGSPGSGSSSGSGSSGQQDSRSAGQDNGGSGQAAGGQNGSVMGNLRLATTTLANKSGVVVLATGASKDGIDLSFSNSNSCPVTVTVNNVRVNGIQTDVSVTADIDAKAKRYDLLPITDDVLSACSITEVRNISVSVKVEKHEEDVPTPTPRPKTEKKPVEKEEAGTKQEAPRQENPPAAISGDVENDENEHADGGGDNGGDAGEDVEEPTLYDGSDRGDLIGSFQGIEIYGKYVYTGYDSRFIITTVNSTGRNLKMKVHVNSVFGSTENSFDILSDFSQHSLFFNSNYPLINGDISVYDLYTKEELGSTGNFTVTK